MKHLFFVLIISFCLPGISAGAQGDEVLVKWRDLNLTQDDYQAALRALPERDRLGFALSMARITGLLNKLLLNRTLAADARQLGLDSDPLIQREIILAEEALLASRRLEAFEKSLKIPDLAAIAEERYRTKPEEYREPEQVRASHVLVDTKARNDEDARARAELVREKALAGADFAALAAEFSDDTSAKSNRGDLGFFGRGRMAKPFEDAAFSLTKPGDISPVVRSQFGYHVILLQERRPARQKSFVEVRDALLGEVRESFVARERSRYLESITADKSIVLNTPAIDKLKTEAPGPPVTPPESRAAATTGK